MSEKPREEYRAEPDDGPARSLGVQHQLQLMFIRHGYDLDASARDGRLTWCDYELRSTAFGVSAGRVVCIAASPLAVETVRTVLPDDLASWVDREEFADAAEQYRAAAVSRLIPMSPGVGVIFTGTLPRSDEVEYRVRYTFTELNGHWTHVRSEQGVV